MGFFGDSDGDDMDFGRHTPGIFFGSLKLLGSVFGKTVRDLQTARQRAAIAAAAREGAQPQETEPESVQATVNPRPIAVARPNLTPLQPKSKT